MNDVDHRIFPSPAPFMFQQWQPTTIWLQLLSYYIFRPCYCSKASYTMLKMYTSVAQNEHMVSFHRSYVLYYIRIYDRRLAGCVVEQAVAGRGRHQALGRCLLLSY